MTHRVNKTDGIKNFLNAKAHQDLAQLYSFEMEVQLNVAQGRGERVDADFKGKKGHSFEKDGQRWYPIRIPRNAATDPEYEDSPLTFSLDEHCEGIGLTGWNWSKRHSIFFAYDFDAIVGHSVRHTKKLSDDDLKKVVDSVHNIPWVQVRKSAGGKGFHLYVFLETPIQTSNHNEHAALARYTLGLLSGLTGFDFLSKVDICGGNMWIWHRKMSAENQGLTLVKPSTPMPNSLIQDSWRNLVPGKTKHSKEINELCSQKAYVQLDQEHQSLIQFLNQNNCRWWYDNDNKILTCHTFDLKRAHSELKLKGIFETLSSGKDQGSDINCFAFPLPGGAWNVRRYSKGTKEHPFWEQDGAGWTKCNFNKVPDLKTAIRAFDGVEHPNGSFIFTQAQRACEALNILGATVFLPEWIKFRAGALREHKDGRIIFEIKYEESDTALEGFLKNVEKKSKPVWIRVIGYEQETESLETSSFDNIVRHLITPDNEDSGWVLATDKGWSDEPLGHVVPYLKAKGFNPNKIELMKGNAIAKPWVIVNEPFKPEYPGGREWNRYAAQLRYQPLDQKDELNFETWLKVLTHLGTHLNEAVLKNEWCKTNLILTGSDYLKCWIASLLQFPSSPLPYLFFYSDEENTGKSTLADAISLLLTKGVQKADTALLSQQGFNGELESAILCIVEELDITKNKQAANRIKDWVTSPVMSIHPKGATPYHVPNKAHFIQTSNSHLSVPLFPGDSRITLVRVTPPEKEIPKDVLIAKLKEEAQHFVTEILNLELPKPEGRLNIPVLNTSEKYSIEAANKTNLRKFIDESCAECDGSAIKFSEFVLRFQGWLKDPMEIMEWNSNKISREFPTKFPKGRLRGSSYTHIGNIRFNDVDIKPGNKLSVNKDGILE